MYTTLDLKVCIILIVITILAKIMIKTIKIIVCTWLAYNDDNIIIIKIIIIIIIIIIIMIMMIIIILIIMLVRSSYSNIKGRTMHLFIKT